MSPCGRTRQVTIFERSIIMRIKVGQNPRSSSSVAVVSLILCGALLSGCQSKTAHSGFLGDYSELRPSSEYKGTSEYKNPDLALADYDKFMIDPILVHFAPNAKGTAMDPAKVKKVTDYAGEQLREALSKRYQVVSAPGPGVLRLRIALTDIKKTIPAMNILPQTKLSGVGVGGASMEAEALDSQSGERVLAVVASGKGSFFAYKAGLESLGNAKEVIRKWAERFVERLDKAHGYTGD